MAFDQKNATKYLSDVSGWFLRGFQRFQQAQEVSDKAHGHKLYKCINLHSILGNSLLNVFVSDLIG